MRGSGEEKTTWVWLDWCESPYFLLQEENLQPGNENLIPGQLVEGKNRWGSAPVYVT